MALTVQQAVDGIQARHGGGNYNARYDNTDASGNYRIQVSEFVVDHTVTLDWFTVNPTTGAYTSDFNGYSGNLNDFNVKDNLNANAIEVGYGRFNANPATKAAYIDFHSSGGGCVDNATIDYDARIIVWGGSKTANGEGNIEVEGKDIRFYPKGAAGSFLINAVTNAGINYGNSKLKLMNDGSALQARNAADTAFIRMDAASFNVGSKREFKENIQEKTESVLEKIKGTKAYSYNLIEDVEKAQHLGLIYEEAPEELKGTENTIDLYAMNTMLWKAVQELTAKIEKLENK
jgi:hypothetical protein